MQNIKHFAIIVILATLFGCGGALGSWDEFTPRSTVATDLERQTFDFSWLPEGNPIDDDIEAFMLSFGDFDGTGKAEFTLSEPGKGSATGEATLSSGELLLSVESSVGESELGEGDERTVEIETDEDDGRIRLTRESDDTEATSDPRETY